MEKEYAAWDWVTADQIVSHGPCELLYAHLIPKSAATATSTIYDGVNTNGDIIASFRTAESRACEIAPPEPIKCLKGIYVDVAAQTKGIFVMWRPLRYEEARK